MQDPHGFRMRNRQFFSVGGRKVAGEPAIDKDQVFQRVASGFEDVEAVTLPTCEVGCAIHSPEEIGGVDCETGELLCTQHAKTQCSACHRLVGPVTQMIVFGSVYCRTHGRRVILISGAVVFVFGLAVFLAVSHGCTVQV